MRTEKEKMTMTLFGAALLCFFSECFASHSSYDEGVRVLAVCLSYLAYFFAFVFIRHRAKSFLSFFRSIIAVSAGVLSAMLVSSYHIEIAVECTELAGFICGIVILVIWIRRTRK